MKPIECELLLGILRATCDLEEAGRRLKADRWAYGDRYARARVAVQIDLLKEVGVRVDVGAFLGSSDPAARKAAQRGLEALEAAGFITRGTAYGETRLTHAKLTEAGREAAAKLTAAVESVDGARAAI
jgi:hypothetical protein